MSSFHFDQRMKPIRFGLRIRNCPYQMDLYSIENDTNLFYFFILYSLTIVKNSKMKNIIKEISVRQKNRMSSRYNLLDIPKQRQLRRCTKAITKTNEFIEVHRRNSFVDFMSIGKRKEKTDESIRNHCQCLNVN